MPSDVSCVAWPTGWVSPRADQLVLPARQDHGGDPQHGDSGLDADGFVPAPRAEIGGSRVPLVVLLTGLTVDPVVGQPRIVVSAGQRQRRDTGQDRADQPTLSRIETGKQALDSLSQIVGLANALQIPPSELMRLPVPAPANGHTDNPERHPFPANRAAYWRYYGRALARLRRRHDDAVAALRTAEDIFPTMVYRDPILRDVVVALLARSRRDSSMDRQLRGMAYRTGLSV